MCRAAPNEPLPEVCLNLAAVLTCIIPAPLTLTQPSPCIEGDRVQHSFCLGLFHLYSETASVSRFIQIMSTVMIPCHPKLSRLQFSIDSFLSGDGNSSLVTVGNARALKVPVIIRPLSPDLNACIDAWHAFGCHLC